MTEDSFVEGAHSVVASRVYAYIVDGAVHEIIQPFYNDAGEYVEIEARYHPDFVSACVDITHLDPRPKERDRYVEGVFIPYEPTIPSPEHVLAENTAMRDSLIALATARVAPLQDAVDLEMATPEEQAQLLAWKRYRVQVNRVDLTAYPAVWPDSPPM